MSAKAIDNNSPGELWLTAYGLYEQAEQFYNKENYYSSFVYFQNALKMFNNLRERYPAWNYELVTYRVTCCEEKETIIKNRLFKFSVNKSLNELIRENIELQTNIAEYQDKLANEQSKQKNMYVRLERDHKEFLRNSEAADKLKHIIREKIELEKKYSLANEILEKETIESSNLIQSLRTEIECQHKRFDVVFKKNLKMENSQKEWREKYSEMLRIKADIDYQLKEEKEQSKNRELRYIETSKKIKLLSDEIKQLTIEKNNLTEKLSITKTNLKEEKSNRSNLGASIRDSYNGVVVQLSSENEELKKRVEEFQNEVDRLTVIGNSYSYELYKSKDLQENTNKTISSLQAKYCAAREEINALTKGIETKEAKELEYSKKITDMTAKIAESKEEYNILTAKYEELVNKQQSNSVAMQNKSLDLEQEKKQLLEQLKNYQLLAEQARRESAEMHNTKEELEKEQIAMIRNNLSLNLENETKYKQKIEDLSRTNKRLKELEALNEEKEHKIDELSNKIKSSEENYAKLCQDNAKKCTSYFGYCQSALASLTKDNQEFKNTITNANNKIASLEKDKKNSFENIKNLTNKLNEADRKEKYLESLISLSEEKNIALNTKISENSEIKIQKQKLEESLLFLKEGLKKKELTITESKKQIESLTQKVNELNDSLLQSNNKITSIQTEYEKMLTKNMNIEKSFQNLNKESITLRHTLEGEKIRARNLEDINKSFQIRLLNAENKIAVSQNVESKKNGKIKALNEKLDNLEKQLFDSTSLVISQNSKVQEFCSIIDFLKKDKSDLLQKLESLVLQSYKLAKEKEDAINKCFDIEKIARKSLAIDATESVKKKMNDLVHKNKELSKKLVKISKQITLGRAGLVNTDTGVLSLENKKRASKLLALAGKAIKDSNYVLGYRYLSQAADILSNNYALQKDTGILAMNCGDYANATVYLSQAKKLNAANSWTPICLGVCLMNIGEFHKALLEFSEASDIEGSKTELGKLLEVFCIDLTSYCRKAKTSGSTGEQYLQSPEVFYHLAELLITCSPPRIQEAEKWYKIAIKNGAQHDSVMEQKLYHL